MSGKGDSKAGPIEPGPKATPEQVSKADAEVLSLLRQIHDLNLPYAADHIRKHRPSAEAIAWLAYRAYDIFTRTAARQRAMMPRKNSLIEQVRQTSVTSYQELRDKRPDLVAKYGKDKKPLIDAISKAKRRK